MAAPAKKPGAAGAAPKVVSYYPGCSLESTALEYDQSARAVCEALGVEVRELPDWNCCGASSAHTLSHELALSLPARNLAIAQSEGLGVLVAPCAACYNRLRRADAALREGSERSQAIEEAVGEGFHYSSPVRVASLLELLASDIGPAAVASRVRRPLKGLRLVSYYGCLLTRPGKVTGFDSVENPMLLDQLVGAMGAEPVSWSYRTECCGGGLSVARSDAVKRLSSKILDMAVEAKADALITACPMCLANLEMRRSEGQTIPVFYFTELLALAFGLPGVGGLLKKHLIDPGQVLAARGIAI